MINTIRKMGYHFSVSCFKFRDFIFKGLQSTLNILSREDLQGFFQIFWQSIIVDDIAIFFTLRVRLTLAIACRSVCSLSLRSRYMTCSIGASKPVKSMSLTIRMLSLSSSIGLLKRLMAISWLLLSVCLSKNSSSLWLPEIMTAHSGPLSRSIASL